MEEEEEDSGELAEGEVEVRYAGMLETTVQRPIHELVPWCMSVRQLYHAYQPVCLPQWPRVILTGLMHVVFCPMYDPVSGVESKR